jgi:hypothetical protein
MNKCVFLKKISLPACCIDSAVVTIFSSYAKSKKPGSAAFHRSNRVSKTVVIDGEAEDMPESCDDEKIDVDRCVQNFCIIVINFRRCVSINS